MLLRAPAGGGYDKARLRQYELNKLKYYFAVIECDAPSTANSIYTQCDGMEYEVRDGRRYAALCDVWMPQLVGALVFLPAPRQRTSNMFDLQFIPDDVEFSSKPRDTATHVPKKYAPQLVSAPMQKTQIEPTWDQPDTVRGLRWQGRLCSEPPAHEHTLTVVWYHRQRRVKMMRWEQNPHDAIDDEQSFKAFLASSGSDSDDSSIIDPDASDGEGGKPKKLRLSKKQMAVRNKYKSLLEGLVELDDAELVSSNDEGDDQGSDAESQGKTSKKSKKKKKSKDTMSMAYTAGQEVLKKISERKARENESVFERDQRKLKEKRRAKREARRAKANGGEGAGESSTLIQGDGFFVDGECSVAHPHAGDAPWRAHVTYARPACVTTESLENDPFFAGARDDEPTPTANAARRPRLSSSERRAKREERAAERAAKQREAAELELLMMDDVRVARRAERQWRA